MKKLIALLLALLMVLSLAACASGSKDTKDDAAANDDSANTADTADTDKTDDTAKADSDIRVMLVSYDQSTFPMIEFSGVEDAAKEYGFEPIFQSPPTYPDLAGQINIIEMAAADGVDAVIVHPADSDGICATLQSVSEQGMGVFIVDTGVADTTGTVAFIGADNYDYGSQCADAMVEELGKVGKDGGKVAVLSCNEASLAHSLRVNGFKDKVASDYPNLEIVDIQYDMNDPLKASQMATAFMLTYTDLDGIYGTGDIEAAGIVSAVAENGTQGKYVIICGNSNKALNDAMREGVITASVLQSGWGYGYYAAEAAYKWAKDGTTPDQYEIFVPLMKVTGETIDSPEAANYKIDD